MLIVWSREWTFQVDLLKSLRDITEYKNFHFSKMKYSKQEGILQ